MPGRGGAILNPPCLRCAASRYSLSQTAILAKTSLAEKGESVRYKNGGMGSLGFGLNLGGKGRKMGHKFGFLRSYVHIWTYGVRVLGA